MRYLKAVFLVLSTISLSLAYDENREDYRMKIQSSVT
jgi:hypothetical protein